jgi:hypothetical protein
MLGTFWRRKESQARKINIFEGEITMMAKAEKTIITEKET